MRKFIREAEGRVSQQGPHRTSYRPRSRRTGIALLHGLVTVRKTAMVISLLVSIGVSNNLTGPEGFEEVGHVIEVPGRIWADCILRL